MKLLKFISIFIVSITLNNSLFAKPLPPGAGDGEVAANILILVDSSASMNTWIGDQGLGAAPRAVYDSQNRVLINQYSRRSRGLLRYGTDGKRDTTFAPIRVTPAAGCTNRYDTGGNNTVRRNVRRNAGLQFVENLTTLDITTATNTFFFISRERNDRNMIYGFKEDGSECIFAKRIVSQGAWVQDIDVKYIGDTPYLFAMGRKRRGGFFESCNLSTMACNLQEFGRGLLSSAIRLSANNEGTRVYFTDRRDGSLHGYELEEENGTLALGSAVNRCTRTSSPNLSSQMAYATTVAISPDSSNVAYVGSHIDHSLQKLDPTTCNVITHVGTGSRSTLANTGDAGSIDGDDVRFSRIWGVSVTGTKVITATARGYIDVFDEDKFTTLARNDTWQKQMGGPRIRRWDGVKQAINAIVNDTTLTTGAHFGFGHWNAGESGRGKNSTRGGYYCHTRSDCSYYKGWAGFNSEQVTTEVTNDDGDIISSETNQVDTGTQTAEHPNGTSTLCNTDSCLNVAISARGSELIMSRLEPLGLAWGTDAHAFSDIALRYFEDENAGGKIYDPTSTCQLNYVIVIGDGAMKNTGVRGQPGNTDDRIEKLRKMGIKTLFVAYGGGIRGGSMNLFDDLARIGSCEQAGDDDCEATIIADTPEQLKTELTSKIRQIIADKLAFTAPSITATIQEGGALYQAQFAYEQYGEWQGTILRKTIRSDGTVDHNIDAPNNWSAAKMVKSQATDSGPDGRKLWTAMPGASYVNNWNNFDVDRVSAITSMFSELGYEVPDYHNASSHCSSTAGVENGNSDDILGLINFIRGRDYFDYNGNCKFDEVRDHVMGDVYHSQLIEVGPPDANVDFTNTNEEAYYRSINGYQAFMTKHSARENIIYAGSNSGILHAIDAKTGEEVWGFIPPFVGALLPQLVNKGYDGKIDIQKTTQADGTVITTASGGTNPIFGVDGSPVVHDVFIKGYKIENVANVDTLVEDERDWRTILFVPYGRGGAGFSVLDVTTPKKPLHMYSIFNDQINKRILIADKEGNIDVETYNSGFSSYLKSEEGLLAGANQETAKALDDDDCNSDDDDDTNDCVEQDKIALCTVLNADEGEVGTKITDNTQFMESGTSSCYISDTFHFSEITLEDVKDGDAIPTGLLSAREIVNGVPRALSISSASMQDGLLRVKFGNKLVINTYQSVNEPRGSNQFSISTSCKGATGIVPKYDYTQLGETWSTPRIVRIPSIEGGGDINTDNYVAIMGGGMSKNDSCAGSAVFLVNLEEDIDGDVGTIYGAEKNGGPITIVDTTPAGITSGTSTQSTPNGSDISNAIPAAPVVITPDTAFGIPWRGALVYINDLEGKITKINLTNSNEFNEELFDQTTLFNLRGNTTNARYSYFAMDAGVGVDSGQLMLFGSTGNFSDLGSREDNMDNILYGVIDPHYPFFKHLNDVDIPLGAKEGFVQLAHKGAEAASSIDDEDVCKNVTGEIDEEVCIGTKKAWVIKMGQDENNNFYDPKTYRKASASPTLFKGKVYYPIYQPPPGSNKCSQGSAFICVSDDECGTNNSAKLKLETPVDVNNPGLNACAYVRKGVLSELVIFADKLFANVAGPTGDEDTLFSILSVPGEIMQNKGGWRDSSF